MMNWNKWLVELLPFERRKISMFALCKVLVSPILNLYAGYITWSGKMHIKSGCMPTVCMIEKMVHDELGINISIAPGDGKPVDFLIKTSFSDIDKERQLFALIERYKIAGKSYAYRNEEVLFNIQWTGYVCEKALFAASWNKYICERGKQINRIFFQFIRPDRILIHPEFPVTSKIGIDAYHDINGFHLKTVFEVGSAERQYHSWDTSPNLQGALPSIIIIDPIEDETYKYIAEWVG